MVFVRGDEGYRAPAIAALISLCVFCTDARADVVRANSSVRLYVNIRSSPVVADGNIIGRLTHGQEVELVADGPIWRQVRLPNSIDVAYLSAEWTRVLRAVPNQIELSLPLTNGALPVEVRGTQEEKVYLGIPQGLVGPVVALCSVLILFISGLQTNIRSRNETFRVLRERFEDLRNSEGMRQALKVTPLSGAGGDLKPAPVPSTKSDSDAEKQQAEKEKLVLALLPQVKNELKKHLAEDKAEAVIQAVGEELAARSSLANDWEHTISLQERYWIRAFDEWYITTGGGLLFPGKSRLPVVLLRRTFGVYRTLWDDYYREAIAGTVKDNPMMMVALWRAYRDGHASMDKTFIKDMWAITEDSHTEVETALKAWNEVARKYHLAAVTRPAFTGASA